MNKQQQQQFKSRLVTLRKRLIAEVNSAESALREDVTATGDISSLPTHPGDQDAEGLFEQLAIAANEEALLEQVEGALERLEAGTFGTCENCGNQIDHARLQALPATPFCIDCAKQEEATRPDK